MKSQLYSSKGEKKGEISLPPLFDSKIREDIVAKYYEAEKFKKMQPYFAYAEAGKRHSASGTISHRRHEWKGHYGKGMSRAPRKTMWRRGTQFFWVGAEVSGARGGRRSHPPKPNYIRKINQKEITIAMHSALAATAQESFLQKRYSSLQEPSIKTPIIIESVPKKTKDILSLLKNILGETFSLALKKKTIRHGKGKLRGRKYKSTAGILLVTSKAEKAKMKGIDIRHVNSLSIMDLYPLGRLAIFTQKSLEELK